MFSIQRNINEVENQIRVRDSKGIPTEHLNRYRISFNQFDDNKTGYLSADRFKSCLLSLGYRFIEDNQLKFNSSFQTTMKEVDPNNTGYIAFDVYLDFVTKENFSFDGLDHIIQSFRILSSNKV